MTLSTLLPAISRCPGCDCAPAPPPPPAVLTLSVMGGADQNPDPQGQPTPVEVRVYQLAGTAQFEQRRRVRPDRARAGRPWAPTASARRRFIVAPGETHDVTHELKPGVQAIGVAVLFRDIDHAQWRAIGARGGQRPHGADASDRRPHRDTRATRHDMHHGGMLPVGDSRKRARP